MRKIYIILILFFITSCSNTNFREDKDFSDKELISGFVKDSKKRLPKSINVKTKWIDVFEGEEKIVYVYQIEEEYISQEVIDQIKKANYSSKKIDEVCQLIVGTFYNPIDIEYEFININKVNFLKLKFNKGMC